jgi:hypothetical protein
MPRIDDEEMVEALGSDGPYESLGVALAFGVRNGERRIWAPSDRKTSSKFATYLVSRSRRRNFTSIPLSSDVTGHVPRLLGDPGGIRVGGDPGDPDPPPAEFDEEEHVQTIECAPCRR